MSSLLKWCGQFSMQFGFWEFFFSKNRDVPWERQNIINFYLYLIFFHWFLSKVSTFYLDSWKIQVYFLNSGSSESLGAKIKQLFDCVDFLPTCYTAIPNSKLFLFLSSFLNSRVLNFNISDIAKAWLHMSCKYRMIGDMTVF